MFVYVFKFISNFVDIGNEIISNLIVRNKGVSF